jgi:hypothetical protein
MISNRFTRRDVEPAAAARVFVCPAASYFVRSPSAVKCAATLLSRCSRDRGVVIAWCVCSDFRELLGPSTPQLLKKLQEAYGYVTRCINYAASLRRTWDCLPPRCTRGVCCVLRRPATPPPALPRLPVHVRPCQYCCRALALVVSRCDAAASDAARCCACHRYDGLGILAVKNVPSFVEKRQRLLPLAYQCVQSLLCCVWCTACAVGCELTRVAACGGGAPRSLHPVRLATQACQPAYQGAGQVRARGELLQHWLVAGQGEARGQA